MTNPLKKVANTLYAVRESFDDAIQRSAHNAEAYWTDHGDADACVAARKAERADARKARKR